MPHAAQIQKLTRFAFAALVVLLLAACAAAPTRTDTDAFFVLKEGRIAPTSVRAFTDCLLDGFDKAHFVLTNSTSRQQRRTDSFRVETLGGGRIITISADVFDDGRVVLNESKSAALINTSGQREAFDRCQAQYSATK